MTQDEARQIQNKFKKALTDELKLNPESKVRVLKRFTAYLTGHPMFAIGNKLDIVAFRTDWVNQIDTLEKDKKLTPHEAFYAPNPF